MSKSFEQLIWKVPPYSSSRTFTCGFCGNKVAADRALVGLAGQHERGFIYICTHCRQPTYFDYTSAQYPGSTFGNAVGHLPTNVQTLYQEARDCIAINAFTASIMCSRLLLLHMAGEVSGSVPTNFVAAIEALVASGLVPPRSKDVLDHIRKTGNKATHELDEVSKEDAEQLVIFLEAVLRFQYEFPAKLGSSEA